MSWADAFPARPSANTALKAAVLNNLIIFNLNEKKRTFFIEVSSELVFHNISKL